MKTDKEVSKSLMRAAAIPTPDGYGFGVSAGVGFASPVVDRMSGFIVKSATEHASHGLDDGSIVGAAEVAGALEARVSGFGGRWFAEAFVDGREFNVAILDGPAGPQVLPPAEILFLGETRIVG